MAAKKRIGEINIVPLIDVMLVLLVIVLTTASFINLNNIKVEVPKVGDTSKEKKSVVKAKAITITINKQDEFFYNNEHISFDTLKERLSSLKKDRQIILKGDKKSNLNSFVKLLEALQNNELNNLYIMVEN